MAFKLTPLFCTALVIFLIGIQHLVFGTVPYNGEIREFTQPDGSRIPIKLYGVDAVMYGESLDGYTLIKNKEGWWTYADLNPRTGELDPSLQLYRSEPYRGSFRRLHLRRDPAVDKRIARHYEACYGHNYSFHLRDLPRPSWKKNNPPDEAEDIHQYPQHLGTFRGIVLLVDFSDSPAIHTQTALDNWLNEPGYSGFGNNGSVRDLYLYASDGKLDFVNTVTAYFRAPQTKAYYEAGDYARSEELLMSTLAYFDPQVDFSQFDNDGDGFIESLAMVYAGPGEAFGSGLWPHRGTLRSGPAFDGVRVSGYQVTDTQNRLGIYVFAHESGHLLFNWPDLYGTGDQGLMGSRPSETNPTPPNDVYRADQGWIPIVDLHQAPTNRIYEAYANDNSVYRWRNVNRSGEWFVWVNRANTGRYSILRGSGLQIYHFDRSIGSNSPPNTLSLAVEQADGLNELGQTNWPNPGSDADDFFRSGTLNRFGQSTSPNSRWNDGSGSGLEITNISNSGNLMTFGIGPNPVPVDAPGTLPEPFTLARAKGQTLFYSEKNALVSYSLRRFNGQKVIASGTLQAASGWNLLPLPPKFSGVYLLNLKGSGQSASSTLAILD